MKISCDNSKLDVELIHAFLTEHSQWARGIDEDTVQRSIDNSLCFGGYIHGQQVAFARVISDFATFANLVDVFVVPKAQGQGYGKAIVAAVISHQSLQGLRRFTLATADAHGLYKQFGFTALQKPQVFMERHFPDVYAARGCLGN